MSPYLINAVDKARRRRLVIPAQPPSILGNHGEQRYRHVCGVVGHGHLLGPKGGVWVGGWAEVLLHQNTDESGYIPITRCSVEK